MHLNLKLALCCATVVFLSSLCLGQESQTKVLGWDETAQKPQTVSADKAEKALEDLLESKPKKEKKQKRVKSALDIECSILPNEADQQVCAEAQSRELAKKSAKERQKTLSREPESMAQVREEQRKAEKKRKKVEDYRAGLYARANVQGCDPASVGIHYRAVEESKGGVVYDMTVVNNTKNSISISRPQYGVIVDHLPPDCQMSLHFTPSYKDGMYVNFNLLARSLGTSKAWQWAVSMNKFIVNYKVHDELNWIINQ